MCSSNISGQIFTRLLDQAWVWGKLSPVLSLVIIEFGANSDLLVSFLHNSSVASYGADIIDRVRVQNDTGNST